MSETEISETEKIRKEMALAVARVKGELKDVYKTRLIAVSPLLRSAALTAWSEGFNCAVGLFTSPEATDAKP